MPEDSSPGLKPQRLKRRGEFLAVAGTKRKWAMPGLILQVGPAKSASGLRYGITASRKVGNAVARNRAKRRLRALADHYLPVLAAPGHDYVLIARSATVTRPYPLLISDLKTAISRLKVARPSGPERDSPPDHTNREQENGTP